MTIMAKERFAHHSYAPGKGKGDRDVLAMALLAFAGIGLWISINLVISGMILIVAVIVAMWRPVGAAWAMCAAIPLVAHPVKIGGSTFSLLELSILLAFAGVVARLLFHPEDLRSQSWSLPLRFVAVCGGVLLASAVLVTANMPLTTHQDEALRLLRWTIIEPPMAFLAVVFAVGQRGPLPTVRAIALPAALAAGVALALVVLDPDRFRGDGVPRAVGPYLHPNSLALYLERAGVLMAAAMILGGIQVTRATAVMLAVIATGGAATFSRGFLPAVAAGILLAAYLARKKRIAVATLTAFLLSSVAFAIVVSDRFFGGVGDSFFGARKYVWEASIDMVRDYPVSGIGLDQF
ncbi:MAG: O-antigen ligase family protein, partial [Thermomicrobiales bacterium]